MIREAEDLVADDLSRFMALPGNEQHVAGVQRSDAGADRLGAVTDLDGARRGSNNGCADYRR